MKRAVFFIVGIPLALAGALALIALAPILALVLGALTLLGLSLLSLSNALSLSLRETGEVLIEVPPSPHFERKQQLLAMIRSVQFEVKRSKLSEAQAGELVARYRSELREVMTVLARDREKIAEGALK
jgi:hypothetical protein